MRTNKFFLGFTAILAVGVATAACSGDDDDDGGSTYSLASGEYLLDITDVPTNTCWPASNPLPLDLTTLSPGVTIVSTNGTSFILVTAPPVSTFLPPVEGTISGNDLAADGSALGVALDTSGCTIDITANAVGELTADNEFTVNLTANLNIPASAADDCAVYVGETIPGSEGFIPWPTLTGTSSGTCSLSLNADGFVDET